MSEDLLGSWPSRRRDESSSEAQDATPEAADYQVSSDEALPGAESPSEAAAGPQRPRWLTASEVAGSTSAYAPLGNDFLASHVPLDEEPPQVTPPRDMAPDIPEVPYGQDLPKPNEYAGEDLVPDYGGVTPLTPPDMDTVAPTPPSHIPVAPPQDGPIMGPGGAPLPPPDMGEMPFEPTVIEPFVPPEMPPTEVPVVSEPEGIVDLTGESAVQPVWKETASEDAAKAQPIAPTPASDPIVEDTVIKSVDDEVFPPAHSPVIITEDEDRHQARARALGEVDRGADVVIAPPSFAPPSTYRPWPSFVLILIRLIVAAILIIHATRQVLDFEHTTAIWNNSLLPAGEMWAIATIGAQYLIAVLLILGLAVRGAGIALMVTFLIVLFYLVWGAKPVFVDGNPGFLGETEVLLVVLGLLFAGLGGGAIGVDGAVHRASLEKKNLQVILES